MPKFANAHLVLNSRDRTLAGSNGVYNNFNLTNPGQNLVQGAMEDIALSEVLFPYDIPNVQAGYNQFDIFSGTNINITVVVPPGFYTGTELAAAVTAAIVAAGAANTEPDDIPNPIGPTFLPSVTYDLVSNRFTLVPASDPGAFDWDVFSPFTFPFGVYLGSALAALGKDILSIMGFPKATSVAGIPTLTIGEPGFTGNSAPLVFTQYIDICSPKLCQYQFIRDGSTTSLPRRVDLICRLYVADEISLPTGGGGTVGTRPFVMHRQFKNQRVMRSTANNSVNDVDIQLYDDCGQPLTTTWKPRDFQITFHVYEEKSRENGGGGRY